MRFTPRSSTTVCPCVISTGWPRGGVRIGEWRHGCCGRTCSRPCRTRRDIDEFDSSGQGGEMQPNEWTPITTSTLTCPACGGTSEEQMATDSCEIVYICRHCST